MRDLIKRTITGIGIVVFILGGLWMHYTSFFVVGLVIILGSLHEYYKLIRLMGGSVNEAVGLIAALLFYCLSTLVAAGEIDGRLLTLTIPVFTVAMVLVLYGKGDKPFESLAYTFFPMLYVVVPISLFPFSAFSQEGFLPFIVDDAVMFSPGLVVGFFIIMWANDTGAYLVGSLLGRHRLMERISPKKSWEGFIGGALLALVVAWRVAVWIEIVNPVGWYVTALVISVIGTFGDLFESLLKRRAGVKDSGSIMPGHGGFLDRFDSTLLSFPIVYIIFLILG